AQADTAVRRAHRAAALGAFVLPVQLLLDRAAQPRSQVAAAVRQAFDRRRLLGTGGVRLGRVRAAASEREQRDDAEGCPNTWAESGEVRNAGESGLHVGGSAGCPLVRGPTSGCEDIRWRNRFRQIAFSNNAEGPPCRQAPCKRTRLARGCVMSANMAASALPSTQL